MKKGRKASASMNGGRKAAKLDLTKPAKVPAAGGLRSKSDVFGTIAEQVGIGRRDVAGVFHVMGAIIKADLSKSGPGVFKVPGLMRIDVGRPATKLAGVAAEGRVFQGEASQRREGATTSGIEKGEPVGPSPCGAGRPADLDPTVGVQRNGAPT